MMKSDLYTENKTDPVSCSDVIQVVLDVAGSIPAVGDAAQAAVGEAVGKAGNAVLRVMPALVPLMANLPDIFQKLKDMMPKGAQQAPGKAAAAAKKAKACSGMSKGKVQTGAKKSNSQGKININIIKTNGKAVCVNGKCFTGDTPVLTKSGLRPIKEICKGDDIYSRNEETGETGFQKVREVFVTEAHTIYHIQLDGREEVKTTAYHSFFVKDRGWVTAIQLRENDLLETMEGTICITGITKVRHDEPVEVYNFHVEEWSSYFVTENQVYVHNNEEHIDKTDTLDWSNVSAKGETAVEHVREHEVPKPERRKHGVFNEDAIATVEDAWSKREMGESYPDGMGCTIYNIPYPNAGYESGKENTGTILNHVTIIVKEGTSKVITAFPSYGDYRKI